MKKLFTIVALLTLICVAAAGAFSQVSDGSNPPHQNQIVAVAPPGGLVTPTATEAVTDEFIIGTGDLLAINVWKETEISRTVPVRSDGRISLPLIGELQAAGRTPRGLEDEISKKLKDYVSEPEVTVIVQEIRSQKFNVLGMVMRPGSYPLTKPMTVIDAIALAGGFRDFAKQKDIYILRRDLDGKQTRVPFNYKDVVKGRNTAQNIELQSSDTLVVP